MALQLNNAVGFETADASEAYSLSGTPTYRTSGQIAGHADLQIDSGQQYHVGWVASGITDAGSDYIVSFKFQCGSGGMPRMWVHDDGAGLIAEFRLNASGYPFLLDANLGTIDSDLTTALDDGAVHEVVIYAQLNSASGDWAWWIDGTSQGSGTGADLTDGNAFGGSGSYLGLLSLNSVTCYFDDLFIWSGAASSSDALLRMTVKGYNNTAGGATEQGSTLDTGTWSNAATVPFTDATECSYGTANAAGSAWSDAGTRSGPNGDSDLTGATIYGAKWLIRAYQTGSSGSQFLRYGSSGGTTDAVDGTDITLTGTPAVYEWLSESTNVPTASQYFALGMGRTGGGNKDIFTTGHMGMLFYQEPVPAQSQAIAVASETDSTFAIGRSSGVLVGSETDSALPVTRPPQSQAVTLATETDATFPLAPAVALTTGLEANAAFSLGKASGLLTSTETDAVQAVLRSLSIATGAETDTTFSVARLAGIILASEAESAGAVGLPPQVLAYSTALEGDTAPSLFRSLGLLVTTETDAVFGLDKVLGMFAATEAASAFVVTPSAQTFGTANTVTETDTTFPLDRALVLAYGNETDLVLAVAKAMPVLATAETSATFALGVILALRGAASVEEAIALAKAAGFPVVTETDSALSVSAAAGLVGSITAPNEVDAAFVLGASLGITAVNESDLARGVRIPAAPGAGGGGLLLWKRRRR